MSTDHDERLDEVLAEYMERIDQGDEVDESALMEAYPHLAEDLRAFFSAENLVTSGLDSSLVRNDAPRRKSSSQPSREQLQAQLEQLTAQASQLQEQLESLDDRKTSAEDEHQPAAKAAPAKPKAPPRKRRPRQSSEAKPIGAAAAPAPKNGADKGEAKGKANPKRKSDADRKNEQARDESDEKEAPEEKEKKPSWLARTWRRAFRGPASAAGISTVVHAAVVVVLALIAISVDRETLNVHTLVSEFEKAPEEIEQIPDEVEVDLEVVDETLTTNIDSELAEVKLDIGDPGSATVAEMDVGAIASLEVGLGGLDGDALDREIGFGDGKGGGDATFFGIRSSGKRFVYVIDNSKSMNGGKFETACAELMRSVNNLNHYQSFYVVFFSDKAYPLFHPNPVTTMVPANADYKEQLASWLPSVELILKTKAKEAVLGALNMRPDGIFILTDGRFTDDTEQVLLKMVGQPVPIHTILFVRNGKGDPKGEQTLRRISAAHNGTFRTVEVVKNKKK